MRSVEEIQAQFDGPLGEGVPKEAKDAVKLVEADRGSLPSLVDTSPSWSVTHGDAHIGNFFADAGGRPGLLRLAIGLSEAPWYIDVGYQVASSLDVDDRRSAEEGLLRHYRDRLAAEGGGSPSSEEVQMGCCLRHRVRPLPVVDHPEGAARDHHGAARPLGDGGGCGSQRLPSSPRSKFSLDVRPSATSLSSRSALTYLPAGAEKCRGSSSSSRFEGRRWPPRARPSRWGARRRPPYYFWVFSRRSFTMT